MPGKIPYVRVRDRIPAAGAATHLPTCPSLHLDERPPERARLTTIPVVLVVSERLATRLGVHSVPLWITTFNNGFSGKGMRDLVDAWLRAVMWNPKGSFASTRSWSLPYPKRTRKDRASDSSGRSEGASLINAPRPRRPIRRAMSAISAMFTRTPSINLCECI